MRDGEGLVGFTAVRVSRHKRPLDEQAEQIAQLSEDLAAARARVERLEQIINEAPMGVVSFAADMSVEFVSRPVFNASGVTDVATFTALDDPTVHPDDVAAITAANALARSGQRAQYSIRVLAPTGEWAHVDGTLVPMFVDGRPDGLVSVFRDVTRSRRLDDAVQRFKAIADVTTDIVGIASLDGLVLYLNPAGQRFLGRPDDGVQHLSEFFEHIPRDYHRVLMRDAFAAVMQGEVWQGDVALISGQDLARRPMSAVVVGVRDTDGELVAFAVTYRDLTDRKRLEAELAYAAAHDPLTGLANRQELFKSLETSIASGAPTTVLFFDLDNFKVVNDSLGHAVGDQVLTKIAERIRSGARGTDAVGRLGGDEFLVICRGVSRPHDALTIANNILASVRQPMEIAGRQHSVTGSIGISLTQSEGGRPSPSAASLIQEADIAMYRAKRAGRRQAVLFDDSMRVEAIDRLELERELRLAIERDEFELYYQPLVHFGRAAVQNFEALIRWNHPRHGLLLPDEFLPLVEQVGLTGAVGRWVFAGATKAAGAMRLIEPDLCIGVNVHPDQIRQPGFVDSVTRSMLAARITGEAIAIEITEHAVTVDVEHSRRVLEELQHIGVSIVIDDFGTGYSNLDLLRRLPVDFLKIDRSFIAGLGTEPGDTQLVRMIVGLSRELGITVVAEGVETELQEAELIRLSCEIGQGYRYGRPMPFADAMSLLRAQQAGVTA